MVDDGVEMEVYPNEGLEMQLNEEEMVGRGERSDAQFKVEDFIMACKPKLEELEEKKERLYLIFDRVVCLNKEFEDISEAEACVCVKAIRMLHELPSWNTTEMKRESLCWHFKKAVEMFYGVIHCCLCNP